jgi:hypothetical protein
MARIIRVMKAKTKAAFCCFFQSNKTIINMRSGKRKIEKD